MNSINYIEDVESWRSGFWFSVPIKVRFSETDLYGHVNNTAVFIYFEQARIEYLQSLGLFTNLEKDGMVVADLQCNFLQQMYFNETIDLYVKTAEIGNSSFDLHYLAVNNEKQITLTGRGRMVYIDVNLGKSKAIPEKNRRILQNEIAKIKIK